MTNEWWWVKNDGGYSWGPFDTERDARITAKALSTHADWMTWEVTND